MYTSVEWGSSRQLRKIMLAVSTLIQLTYNIRRRLLLKQFRKIRKVFLPECNHLTLKR